MVRSNSNGSDKVPLIFTTSSIMPSLVGLWHLPSQDIRVYLTDLNKHPLLSILIKVKLIEFRTAV